MSLSLLIIFMFYFQRWQFISKYVYSTNQGIDCFYEKGAIIYLKYELDKVTDNIINTWSTSYEFDVDKLCGVVCIFEKENAFVYGWWSRKVCGIAGWNWMIVGQGGKPIQQTAYGHELSHIIYNIIEGKMTDENESHLEFRKMGV